MLKRFETEAAYKAWRQKQETRLRKRRSLVEQSEAAGDMLELEMLVEDQARRLRTLERELRKLRDLHQAHEWIRLGASWFDLDSITLIYAFFNWVQGLSEDELEQLRRKAAAEGRHRC